MKLASEFFWGKTRSFAAFLSHGRKKNTCALGVKPLNSHSKGRRKKMFFLLSVKRGVGGLGQSKKFLSENTLIFLTKGGWSHPIQKGSIRFVGISYQKLGFYIKNWLFLTNFSPKRGGVWAESKKSLSEKTEVVKKRAGGGGSEFVD